MMPRFNWADTDVRYINLAHRTDRDELMRAELDRVGIVAERFEAMTPDAYQGDERKVATMRARTPGAIGCCISQMNLIALAVYLPQNVCILEDDVIFCDDFNERMRYIEDRIDAIDPEWDVFSFGACFHLPGDDRQWHLSDHLGRDFDHTSDPRIKRVYGSWFTYAYVVRAESAKKVLDLLDENCHRSFGIDHNFILLGDRVRAYCFVPGIAFQRDGQSDIGNGITHFSHFRRLGPYVFQPRMAEFDPVTFDWTYHGPQHERHER